MDIRFADPNSSKTLSAEVDDWLTGSSAIQHLVRANFVPPATGTTEYELVNTRTQAVILPETSLSHSGVCDGDVIEVRLSTEGARR